MPLTKLAPLVGTIALLIALVVGISYVTNTHTQTQGGEEVYYVLAPVKDGTYAGALPPLTTDVSFDQTLPAEAQRAIQEKVDSTIEALKRTPYDGNLWMELALYYHSGGDFARARTVWEFMIAVDPNNVTALGNLGRLHHFQLKEYVKAEEYFNQAIATNPDRPEAYYELFDLYRYSYKQDTTAAVDIMKRTAVQFPDDINVPLLLGGYYRDTGRPNQARAQFEDALTRARSIGDVTLIQNITNELARIQ
jgi:tetratricopeptide (TPR) repeat protein